MCTHVPFMSLRYFHISFVAAVYVIVLFTFIQLITTVLAQLSMTVVCHLLSVVSFSPSVCLSLFL